MTATLIGKTALVTGGASGIGRAIVEAFTARGTRAIAADINQERAADLAGQLGYTR
jgi:NAD(P)-dependent dehydrogenase (short-subunit alcohol dehydrogenase family)